MSDETLPLQHPNPLKIHVNKMLCQDLNSGAKCNCIQKSKFVSREEVCIQNVVNLLHIKKENACFHSNKKKCHEKNNY